MHHGRDWVPLSGSLEPRWAEDRKKLEALVIEPPFRLQKRPDVMYL